jgi:HSP20 family protein
MSVASRFRVDVDRRAQDEMGFSALKVTHLRVTKGNRRSMTMTDKNPGTVGPWEPFRELDLFRGWPSGRLFEALRESGAPTGARWAPSADMSENDDAYVVSVELAGAKKGDVNVEVHDGVLKIRGEKRNEREEEDEKRRYSERTYGLFSRSFRLPSDANEKAIKATFENGVLCVEIAKREDRKPRVIQVR